MVYTMNGTRSGETLKQLRDAAGLKPRELADLVGKTESAIYKMESGEIGGTRQTIEALDEALNAGGSLLAAYGLTPPEDFVTLISELRAQVIALAEQVQVHAELLVELGDRMARCESERRQSNG